MSVAGILLGGDLAERQHRERQREHPADHLHAHALAIPLSSFDWDDLRAIDGATEGEIVATSSSTTRPRSRP
jgi:hypothetical protein